ncbi:adenosylcobinamide-GDP ribazoletransferase [candidate division KSB3 bacterium]|uniref:Adenosylcobinamide-GDP ribazoletransferase n=1 Tax=candidate division KSB3 bacterium TaxID=2044937 RepID=A0A2G6KA84_9BACT|nr:MAG: adenosylcobinamide-GDP ribazoletransferase [candidate division KSB3 bacterium]
MIRQEIRTLQAALLFFTRIPSSVLGEPSGDSFHNASRYFPFIGWVVGVVGAGTVVGGSFFLPLSLAILMSIAMTILMTGALHEDGFADFCDGFGAGLTKEHILDIMKDSYIGVFGVIGLLLMLGMKMLALRSLPITVLPMAIISGHSLSRFLSISLLATHTYARHDVSSKSRVVVKRMTIRELLFAAILGILPFFFMCLMVSQWRLFGIGLLTTGLSRWLFGQFLTVKIQGYTGDCLGALQQISEVVFYMTVVAVQ